MLFHLVSTVFLCCVLVAGGQTYEIYCDDFGYLSSSPLQWVLERSKSTSWQVETGSSTGKVLVLDYEGLFLSLNIAQCQSVGSGQCMAVLPDGGFTNPSSEHWNITATSLCNNYFAAAFSSNKRVFCLAPDSSCSVATHPCPAVVATSDSIYYNISVRKTSRRFEK